MNPDPNPNFYEWLEALHPNWRKYTHPELARQHDLYLLRHPERGEKMIDIKVGQVWQDIYRPGLRSRQFVIVTANPKNRLVDATVVVAGESFGGIYFEIGKTMFASREYFNGPERRYELTSQPDQPLVQFFRWFNKQKVGYRTPEHQAELQAAFLAGQAEKQ
jgi:hypothetical protein